MCEYRVHLAFAHSLVAYWLLHTAIIHSMQRVSATCLQSYPDGFQQWIAAKLLLQKLFWYQIPAAAVAPPEQKFSAASQCLTVLSMCSPYARVSAQTRPAQQRRAQIHVLLHVLPH